MQTLSDLWRVCECLFGSQVLPLQDLRRTRFRVLGRRHVRHSVGLAGNSAGLARRMALQAQLRLPQAQAQATATERPVDQARQTGQEEKEEEDGEVARAVEQAARTTLPKMWVTRLRTITASAYRRNQPSSQTCASRGTRWYYGRGTRLRSAGAFRSICFAGQKRRHHHPTTVAARLSRVQTRRISRNGISPRR